MSTLSQFSGGGIKSIQRGAIAVTGTTIATITAVNTAKTILNFCGCTAGRSTTYTGITDMARIQLTSSTQITATRLAGNANPAPTVSYEVIEYF
jgi:hypothetical protein